MNHLHSSIGLIELSDWNVSSSIHLIPKPIFSSPTATITTVHPTTTIVILDHRFHNGTKFENLNESLNLNFSSNSMIDFNNFGDDHHHHHHPQNHSLKDFILISAFRSSESNKYFESFDTNTSASTERFVFNDGFDTDSSFYIVTVSFLLGLLTLATIIGNVFVIAAILTERNLRTTANYLVLSLAVADLMVACFVMPLGAVSEISQQWSLGTLLCDIWTSADVLCCTASILHLLAIALDRYWAVTYVDYIHRRTSQRIFLMIFTVWTMAAIVSIGPLVGWKDADFNIRVEQEKRCLISQDIGYQIFATICTFYGPLVFILLLYWKIYQVARKRIRHKPGKTIVPEYDRVRSKLMNHSGETNTSNNIARKLETSSSSSPSSFTNKSTFFDRKKIFTIFSLRNSTIEMQQTLKIEESIKKFGDNNDTTIKNNSNNRKAIHSESIESSKTSNEIMGKNLESFDLESVQYEKELDHTDEVLDENGIETKQQSLVDICISALMESNRVDDDLIEKLRKRNSSFNRTGSMVKARETLSTSSSSSPPSSSSSSSSIETIVTKTLKCSLTPSSYGNVVENTSSIDNQMLNYSSQPLPSQEILRTTTTTTTTATAPSLSLSIEASEETSLTKKPLMMISLDADDNDRSDCNIDFNMATENNARINHHQHQHQRNSILESCLSNRTNHRIRMESIGISPSNRDNIDNEIKSDNQKIITDRERENEKNTSHQSVHSSNNNGIDNGNGAENIILNSFNLKPEPTHGVLNEIQMRKVIKESIESKRERKAAKILAIITGIFVICWLPFFVMALVMPLCKVCQTHKYIFSTFLWLGYLNSLLNPIIYTIFSPDFRNGFRRILCGQKRR
ncbi:5-hydroxytryptamine receptor 2A [Sarcoptes scabiei]|uniref:5-hydroxytryptamine receptor 2A n=1 Tax=Sarcoptes scabiei TaxID=52283 RepID=A0A834VHR5_SARSC|nr:5-hydroxytryptamine receptor 2A [Sarcoptes scabiei]